MIFNSKVGVKKHVCGCEVTAEGEEQLNSCFCGLAFPFSSLSLCNKNFPFILSLVCFFGLLITVCGYPKVAISKHFTVNKAETLIVAET